MKIVIDTNVLISSFLFGGLSAEVFDYCYIFHEIYISEWKDITGVLEFNEDSSINHDCI